MRLVVGRSTPAIRAIVLSLPLLVFLVRANHAHDAAAPDDFALVADSLDRSSYLHCNLNLTASPRSAPARHRSARVPTAPDRRPGSARSCDPSGPRCAPPP